MTFPVRFFILFIFIFVVPTCFGEKILFYFAGSSYSMKNSAWPWATILADRGHEVTFFSPYSKQPTNHSKVRDLTSTTLQNWMQMAYGVDRFQQRKDHKDKDILTQYYPMSFDLCERIFLKSEQDAVLQELIHKDTFDLVIVNIIFGECGFIFAAKYNAKTILFDGSVPLTWFFDAYGFTAESSWIPDMLTKYDKFPLPFLDRLTNTFWPVFWFWQRHAGMYPSMDGLMKKAFGRDDAPSYLEMEKNTSLIVINSHPATDYAYSLPPFVIQIGGMQTFLPEQEIPELYQKFMDGAGQGGVVLISFGSTIDLEKISSFYTDMFFNLIRKHKNVRFILKWKGPLPKGFETGLDNLLTASWLPQRELLRHPKMKGFITHGGLNSIQEATFYGVPMIVLPLFADQDYNAFRVHSQKVGFRLEIRDVTFNDLDDSLTKILTDDQYKKNMEVRSKIFRDRPQSPILEVLFWTEFVLRNDDISALRPMNNHLTWWQRRLLDVYMAYGLIILGVTFILGYLVVKVIKKGLGSGIKRSTPVKLITKKEQ